MEDDWTKLADSKEKKRIQNRIAQRVHRKKLKSHIRHLEEQLEHVAGASTQTNTSKRLSSYGDPILSFAGVLPTMYSEPVSDTLGKSLSDISLAGNHASKSLLGSDTSVEWSLNTMPESSTEAQLDSLFWTSAAAQPTDLQWLLTDSGPLRTVLDHTQVQSPSTEGHKTPDHSQSLPSKSLLRHFESSNRVRIDNSSSQSAHEMTTASMVQNSEPETILRSDSTTLDRLRLLVEYGRRLGFSDLNEALSVYYTSDLSKSAILSHEQSHGRVRQLPNFLSSIREHSKHWPSWERSSYVRETLRSAEDIYAEECRLARMQLRKQNIAGLAQKDPQIDQILQITRGLQQEVCSVSSVSTVQRTLTRQTFESDSEHLGLDHKQHATYYNAWRVSTTTDYLVSRDATL